MGRGAEILIIMIALYLMGSWVEMEFNPAEWHMLTRIILVVFMNAVALVAARGGTPTK